MKLGPNEPAATPWRVAPLSELLELVVKPVAVASRPWLVAVDGRSGSGKSTIASRIQQAVANSALIHTDDLAWHHSFFDWSELLIEGILKPLHAGQAVDYQPPGWQPHGREGSLQLVAGLDLVLIEGVGAGRSELSHWLDRIIWVQSDFAEAERRGIARDGGSAAAERFWHEWMAVETPFLQQQRPWERATVIVNGTPDQPHDRSSHVVIARGWRAS